MPRITTARLNTRVEGLALAFFAVSGALLDLLIEMQDDEEEALADVEGSAVGLVVGLAESPQDFSSEAVIREALAAIAVVFSARSDLESARASPGDNDNERDK